MELEEMKNLWKQHDDQLKQNQMLNETIIKRMLSDKSSTAITRMMNYEYLNMATCALVLVVFATQYWNLGNSTSLTVCYIASMVLLVASLSLGIYRSKYLSGIDLATDAVTDAIQKLEKFRLLVNKEKSIAIISFPLILLPVYVIINYWVHHVNMINHMDQYVLRIILAFAVGIPAAILVYKKIYFQNIQQVKANLAEIVEFKRGEP